MLVGAGPNTASNWVHVDPVKSLDIPLGFSYAQHGPIGGNVIIEQLVLGTPGNGPGSPYPPQVGTGTPTYLASIPLDGNTYDLTITTPIEFVRARTDGGVLGTVDVEMTMNS